eukprot:CCRYP_018534-RB/>CCRYP_018534-RB protein AED:0.47 eAED:0.47 QI:0/0/0/1/0/0/3/0/153
MAKVEPKLYRPYIKLRKDLEAFGFMINDYDPCIANKMVNGTQMTVVWHVDDLEVSHKDRNEITKLLIYLIFEDFPEEIGKECSSPASEHLFEIRNPEETKKLNKYLLEELAQHFHHTVAQLLYVGTRVRRDIQTAVVFLTTRVKNQTRMIGVS